MENNKKLTNKEIYSNIILSIQTLIDRKTVDKISIIESGRNKGIEYAAIVNEIGTLERAKRDFLLFN